MNLWDLERLSLTASESGVWPIPLLRPSSVSRLQDDVLTTVPTLVLVLALLRCGLSDACLTNGECPKACCTTYVTDAEGHPFASLCA